jgi:hypothetical protein
MALNATSGHCASVPAALFDTVSVVNSLQDFVAFV